MSSDWAAIEFSFSIFFSLYFFFVIVSSHALENACFKCVCSSVYVRLVVVASRETFEKYFKCIECGSSAAAAAAVAVGPKARHEMLQSLFALVVFPCYSAMILLLYYYLVSAVLLITLCEIRCCNFHKTLHFTLVHKKKTLKFLMAVLL